MNKCVERPGRLSTPGRIDEASIAGRGPTLQRTIAEDGQLRVVARANFFERTAPLFLVQRFHRVDPGRTPRWKVVGQQRHGQQQHGHRR